MPRAMYSLSFKCIYNPGRTNNKFITSQSFLSSDTRFGHSLRSAIQLPLREWFKDRSRRAETEPREQTTEKKETVRVSRKKKKEWLRALSNEIIGASTRRRKRNAREFAGFVRRGEQLSRGWARVSHCPHVVRKRQNNGRYLRQRYTGVVA